jgi:hypothetical protein
VVPSLAIARIGSCPARVLAIEGARWSTEAGASLVIGRPSDSAIVLGAHQRSTDVTAVAAEFLARASGGGSARVGPGSVWLQLRLARSDALLPSPPDKLLNRYVRPLLRALTKQSGVVASYFGRDWISLRHRPVALVGFAHDSRSGRCLFEAIIAATTPLTGPGDPVRRSFRDHQPGTVAELAGRSIDLVALEAAIVEAYAAQASEVHESTEPRPDAPPRSDALDRVPWRATGEEAIGTIGAGPDASGRFRVGGELMVSADALVRLEHRIESLAARGGPTEPDAVGREVDEALTTAGAIVFGIKSLGSIRDVIVAALGRDPQNIA